MTDPAELMAAEARQRLEATRPERHWNRDRYCGVGKHPRRRLKPNGDCGICGAFVTGFPGLHMGKEGTI